MGCPALRHCTIVSYETNTHTHTHTKTPHHIIIQDSCLKELQSLSRPYKYVITAIIMQKNGGGMVSSGSTYWDTVKDGVCKVTWENSTMHCLVTVYGLSIIIDNPTELD